MPLTRLHNTQTPTQAAGLLGRQAFAVVEVSGSVGADERLGPFQLVASHPGYCSEISGDA